MSSYNGAPEEDDGPEEENAEFADENGLPHNYTDMIERSTGHDALVQEPGP